MGYAGKTQESGAPTRLGFPEVGPTRTPVSNDINDLDPRFFRCLGHIWWPLWWPQELTGRSVTKAKLRSHSPVLLMGPILEFEAPQASS